MSLPVSVIDMSQCKTLNPSSPLCRSVVMVPDAELAVSLTKQASEVLPSLTNFKPEKWGLPAFESH